MTLEKKAPSDDEQRPRVRLGAVLLNYGASDFRSAASTLLRVGVPLPNIVVVNNPDGRRSRPGNLGAAVRVVEPNDNRGYGVGMNAGWAELPSDVDSVLLLTPDVEMDAAEFASALDYFQAHDEIGVYGPTLRTRQGSLLSGGGQ